MPNPTWIHYFISIDLFLWNSDIELLFSWNEKKNKNKKKNKLVHYI